MSRVHCDNCDRDGHATWQCTRPKRSTATGNDRSRLSSLSTVPGALQSGRSREGKASPQSVVAADALPVDTNSAPLSLAAANPPRLGSDTRKDSGMSGAGAKFDKVAYQREYMRKRRSKLALNRGET